MVVENADVEPEIVIAVDCQHSLGEEIVVFRLPVSCQTHHFPLVALEHVKAQIVRDRGIELAE